MLERALTLHDLMERHSYRGFDPFDLANSPALSWIPQGWHLPHLVISKFGSRVAPDILRRALRVPAIEDPKIYACAYFGYRLSNRPEFAAPAELMLDRLTTLAIDKGGGAPHWGYDYLWATRGSGVNPRGGSTLVPGSFALFALMHDMVDSGSERRADLIRSALRHYRTEHRCANESGEFLGYFPHACSNTHNANLLGCAALTIGGRLFSDDDCLRGAAQAASTSVAAVGQDGYIRYNDHRTGGWTDCFHHLYVLASVTAVASMNPYVDRDEFDSAAGRLESYYRRHFLREDGFLNYYAGRSHPVDPHNYAATAIYTVLFGGGSKEAAAAAAELLRRVDDMAWDPERGRYLHRLHPRRSDTRFFLRWTQAWMFAALCIVYAAEAAVEQLETVGGRLGARTAA